MVSLCVCAPFSLLIRVVWQAVVWIILVREKELLYHCLCVSRTVNTSSMAGCRLYYSGSG
jgi:hypothetical protein